MARRTPIYDLILLLDLAPRRTCGRRSSPTRARRSAGEGTLLGEQAWGVAHRSPTRSTTATQAEYHLLQFSGPPSLIAALEHTLRITDGVSDPAWSATA